MITSQQFAAVGWAASGLLFISSLALPAFHSETGVVGLIPLLFGWLGLAVDSSSRAWVANPLLFIAWVLLALHKPRVAAGFALFALLFGLSFVVVRAVPLDESGIRRPITRIGIGY